MKTTNTTTTSAPTFIYTSYTWAQVAELQTPANDSQDATQRENTAHHFAALILARLAILWAILCDYAAGTYICTIKPAAAKFGRKVAKVITCAALYIFRAIWFAAILCATLATLAGLASNLADYVPAFFLLRLAAFFGCAAVAVLVEIALIYISKIIDRATDRRLFAMPK